MKNKIIYIASILFILLIKLSCIEDSLGLDTFEKIPHDAVILPLEIGNYWKYSIISYDEGNNKIDNFDLTFTIIDKIEIDGEFWYLQDQGLPPPMVTTYLRNKQDGLWQKSSFNAEAIRITKYPIILNEAFKVGSIYKPNENKYYDIIRKSVSTNNIIFTKAGKFNTICYLDYISEGERIIQDTLNIIYYAPNKGMVMRKRYRVIKNSDKLFLAEKWELTDYKVQIN